MLTGLSICIIQAQKLVICFKFVKYLNMKNGSGKFQFLPGVLSELFSGKCQVGIFANFCRFTHWTWEPVRLKSHKNCALDLGTGNLIGVNSSCYSAAIYTSLLYCHSAAIYTSLLLPQCRNLYLSTTLLQCRNLYLKYCIITVL